MPYISLDKGNPETTLTANTFTLEEVIDNAIPDALITVTNDRLRYKVNTDDTLVEAGYTGPSSYRSLLCHSLLVDSLSPL